MQQMADVSQRRRSVHISLFIAFLLLPQVSADFDKKWCDTGGGNNLNWMENGPFFPRAFSTLAEKSVFGGFYDYDGLSTHSRFAMQFSEFSGQMAVESDSRNGSFSAFVDSKLNVCLLHLAKNSRCLLKTNNPCEDIGRLTQNIRLSGEKVSLKSAKEALGLNANRLKKAVKIGAGQTRGINSIVYVTCEDIDKGAATVISKWHFLDNSKYKVLDSKPVLIMTRSQREKRGHFGPAMITQIDYGNFKQVRDDNFLPNLEHVNSQCISDNMKDVNKTIPIPPESFTCTKETRIGHAGVSIERVRNVKILHYNYDANWFQVNTFLSYVRTDSETKVTEDFNTNVRYEISNAGKWCKTFPTQTLSRPGEAQPRDSYRIASPSEFWNINPDTAIYLGEADIRGVPCDAWRVGLLGSDESKTHTIFLATKKWLKRRRIPIDSFFPLEYLEQTGTIVKHHSYFGFRDTFSDFIPDISPCFNTNHSVGVRFILDTSFYENIKNFSRRFEDSLRKTVQSLTGLDSPLQVANIRARPSLVDPDETRVSFKILGKSGIANSLLRSKSNVQDTGSAMESVEILKKKIKEGTFELKYVVNSTEISVKAFPGSFFLLREGVCEDHQNYCESSSLKYSDRSVVGICILVFLLALVTGCGAIYVYVRGSGKRFGDRSNRPTSSTSITRSIFNIVNVKTEEADWSWT